MKKSTQYEIRVWDNNNVIATYNKFEEIKEKGKCILEIVGHGKVVPLLM